MNADYLNITFILKITWWMSRIISYILFLLKLFAKTMRLSIFMFFLTWQFLQNICNCFLLQLLRYFLYFSKSHHGLLYNIFSRCSLSVKPPSPTDECSPKEDDFRWEKLSIIVRKFNIFVPVTLQQLKYSPGPSPSSDWCQV